MNHGLISKYSIPSAAGKSVCTLCPHRCSLGENEEGRCMVRRGSSAGIEFNGYGKITSINVERIEKKPLYHYKPGMRTLSVGGYGCSMNCSFCANFMVSQRNRAEESKSISPKNLVNIAMERSCEGICFTYNEPTVYFEYVLDVCSEAKAYGIDTIIKTNAYLEEEPWKEMCLSVDAMNIDFKGDEKRYAEVTHSDHSVVLQRISEAMEYGPHMEISVPVYNDSTIHEYGELADVVRHDPEMPIHLLKVYPMNRHIYLTSEKTMTDIRDSLEEHFFYVYCHGIDAIRDTICHKCGSESVRRTGREVDIHGMCGCFSGIAG